MRPLLLLNAVLLTGFLVMSALLWPALPEVIPQHFGLDGTPDRWGERASWWLLPGVATGLTLLFAALGRWMYRNPALVNLPGKAQLLALPPERQRPVLERIADLLWGANALALVLLGLIQGNVYRTALVGPSRGMGLAVLVIAVAMGPLILLGLPYVDAELKRQAEAHRAETASRSGAA